LESNGDALTERDLQASFSRVWTASERFAPFLLPSLKDQYSLASRYEKMDIIKLCCEFFAVCKDENSFRLFQELLSTWLNDFVKDLSDKAFENFCSSLHLLLDSPFYADAFDFMLSCMQSIWKESEAPNLLKPLKFLAASKGLSSLDKAVSFSFSNLEMKEFFLFLACDLIELYFILDKRGVELIDSKLLKYSFQLTNLLLQAISSEDKAIRTRSLGALLHLASISHILDEAAVNISNLLAEHDFCLYSEYYFGK
jgi:hypothetical protein